MRVVVFAYSCEPDKGSEPGAGWVWARMIARLGEAWIVTRANNRPAIEHALPFVPERDRLRFVYVDLPAWARFWKRGQRGVRLYYFLWQAAALREATRLHRERLFDLAWHLTLANAWLGSLAPLVGPPFVYGPVGGGVGVPLRLLGSLGPRGVAYELARVTIRTLARFLNPLARLAWRRAALVLVQNPETRNWLPARHRHTAVVFPNAVIEQALGTCSDERPRNRALFAARLLPWKGASLALRTIARLPEWSLLVVGDGPDARRLRRLAQRLGVQDRVEFRGTLSRAEVLQTMDAEVTLLLHPSLHDDAPFVVAEAVALGLPVVALDRGGPPVLGATCVPARGGSDLVVAALAHAVQTASPRPLAADRLLLDRRADELAELVGSLPLLVRLPSEHAVEAAPVETES